MKDDPIDGHPGFSGGGAISLENMSPLIVDPNEDRVWVDMGAMHARSEVEKRIRFVTDKEEVPNGKPYWIVWTTVERSERDLFIMESQPVSWKSTGRRAADIKFLLSTSIAWISR